MCTNGEREQKSANVKWLSPRDRNRGGHTELKNKRCYCCLCSPEISDAFAAVKTGGSTSLYTFP